MSSANRFMSVVLGESRGVIPCAPLIFGYAASFTGIKLKDYLRNGELLARAQIQTQGYFGYDAVFVNAGNSVEAEALGCVLHYPEQDYPYIIHHALEDLSDADQLKLPEPTKSERMGEMLCACSILRQELEDTLPVVGCVLGPASIAGQLAGLDKLLYLLADDPAAFGKLMSKMMQVSSRFGQALLQAGAQVIMLMDPTASQNIFPSWVFHRFMVPVITELCRVFKQAGAKGVWLMITGRTQEILPYYGECGIDLATVDYEVFLADAVKAASGFALAGNIRPYDFVICSPGEIEDQCCRLIQVGSLAKGFVLSSGCEVPLNSKAANIEVMVRSARGDRRIG